MVANGYVTTFASDGWKISKGAMIVAHRKKIVTLYMIIDGFEALAVADCKVSLQLWHQRLRHMSLKGMKVM